MSKHKNYLYFILVTVAVLGVGLFLPFGLALGVSVSFFAAVAWMKPKLLIPILIIYFSFRPFMVEINEGLKLAGDIGIIVLFLNVIWAAIKQKEYRSIVKLEWYEWAYILFCMVGAIAALFTDVMLIAIIFQLRKFIMIYLLFYGVKRLAWKKQEITLILKVITGIAIVLIAHGFIEKLSQRQWLIPQAWMEQFISSANFERIYGLLGNPNSMGLFMLVTIVASFVLLRQTGKNRWYIPLVLAIGTLLLTYSRGSWLGIIIAGVVYLILVRNTRLIKQMVIAGVAGYLLVFLPITYADQWVANAFENADIRSPQEQGGLSLGDRFSSAFDENAMNLSENTGRLFFIKVGFTILADYPVIGTGFGTFGDSAALVYSSPIYDDYGLKDIYDYMGKDFYSDNQYIQIIVQTGIVGTILFAVFLLNMAYRIWSIRKTHRETANIAILFWIFICVVGVVYNVWENQIFPMIFLMFIAWLETLRNGKSEAFSAINERKEHTT